MVLEKYTLELNILNRINGARLYHVLLDYNIVNNIQIVINTQNMYQTSCFLNLLYHIFIMYQEEINKFQHQYINIITE